MALTWNRPTAERLATLQDWITWLRDHEGDRGLTADRNLHAQTLARIEEEHVALPVVHEIGYGLGLGYLVPALDQAVDQICERYSATRPRYIAVVKDSRGEDWVGIVDQVRWDHLVDEYEEADSDCPVGRRYRLRKDGSWVEDGGWDVRPRAAHTGGIAPDMILRHSHGAACRIRVDRIRPASDFVGRPYADVTVLECIGDHAVGASYCWSVDSIVTSYTQEG